MATSSRHRGTWRWSLAALLAIPLSVPTSPSTAENSIPVAIELVLAVDTSLSVDGREYALQMQGIARAFRNPEIIDLIRQQDGVAVTLFQWSTKVDQRYMIPWQVLRDEPSTRAFATAVEKLPREPSRGFTALGSALEYAVRLLFTNAYDGRIQKIDLSADGRSNTGPLPAAARQMARGSGIVINGLPVLIDTYNLDEYFRDKVIAGPGAFIEIANDYGDFARAFLRKLRRELTPYVSEQREPPDPGRQRAGKDTGPDSASNRSEENRSKDNQRLG